MLAAVSDTDTLAAAVHTAVVADSPAAVDNRNYSAAPPVDSLDSAAMYIPHSAAWAPANSADTVAGRAAMWAPVVSPP